MFRGVYHGLKIKMISIIRDFKNNGYITANIQDVCHKELMSIGRQRKYVYVGFYHDTAQSCYQTMYAFGYNFTTIENVNMEKKASSLLLNILKSYGLVIKLIIICKISYYIYI